MLASLLLPIQCALVPSGSVSVDGSMLLDLHNWMYVSVVSMYDHFYGSTH